MPGLFERNVQYHPYQRLGAWRKIALGTWDHPGDPTIYGRYELNASELVKAIDAAKKSGRTLTPLHFVAAAAAQGVAQVKDANGVIRFGRVYYRKEVNISLPLVADENGDELTAIIVRDAHQKSVLEIEAEFTRRAAEIRSGKDAEFESTKSLMLALPGWMIYPLLRFLGFIYYTLNLWIRPLGIPKDSFGSVQITSLVGVEEGFGPLDPYSRCPINIIVGRIQNRPVVEGDQIVIRPMLNLCFTFDHRVLDGVKCSRFGQVIRKIIERPGAGLTISDPAPDRRS